MCGFVGYISKDKNKKKQIKLMADIIKHRGPDSDGYYTDDNIALGFRRLSIIDLNNGSQPIYNEDKSMVIVFNGEIYNYKALRDELKKKKHKFSTKCDTEVLIHGYEEFGELLFTHFGISGPIVLSASSFLAKYLSNEEVIFKIDLKPALSFGQLDDRILREFEKNINRDFKNSLDALLPKKMIPVMIAYCGIDPNKKINVISKEERQNLVKALKEFTMTVVSLRGYNEAIITQGGIDVKEINPATMESKQIQHLFLAGELLDVDALTGGFNLQIAWSTGHLAGESVY